MRILDRLTYTFLVFMLWPILLGGEIEDRLGPPYFPALYLGIVLAFIWMGAVLGIPIYWVVSSSG